MARVETKGSASAIASGEMERKASQGSTMSGLGRRDSETQEEWDKRRARWEKKEKAKVDEARRLKVIVRLSFFSDLVRESPVEADFKV